MVADMGVSHVEASADDEILELADEHNYLFAEPIVHLQQTDGTVSDHWPFNNRFNLQGIITGNEDGLTLDKLG